MLTRRTRQAAEIWMSLACTALMPLGVAAQTKPPVPSQGAPTAAPLAPSAPPPAQPAADAPVRAPSDQEQTNALDDEARERFSLGRTFYEAGHFREAAEQFDRAYRLSGRPQLLYNLYVAQRDAGNWSAAESSLRGYLEKVPDAPDRITLDARLRSLEEQNAQRRKQAEESAAARKREAMRQTHKEVVHSKVPWIVAASGGALLAGSIVTGVIAKSKDGDVDKACAMGGTVCPEWERSDAKKAYGLAITTDLLWTIGGAAALTGLVLWYTGALDTEREVPVAGLAVTQHGMSGSLTVRY